MISLLVSIIPGSCQSDHCLSSHSSLDSPLTPSWSLESRLPRHFHKYLPESPLPTTGPLTSQLHRRVTLAKSWSRLHTGTHYPACPFPYSTHHLAPPLCHSRIAFPSVPVALPFSRTRPFHTPHACPPGLLPLPSLVLSRLPTLLLCPSPAWISPRCLAFAFVSHTFFGVCIALRPRVTNQYARTKMYGYF